MEPSYSDLVYFTEVARTFNISRAADRLGITQPSLSSAIKRLETVLGVSLLVRSRKGVQLTKAGDELVRQSRHLLLNWEQLRSNIKKKENEVCGQYIIGCHPSVALYSLPGLLPGLVQKYSGLEIRLTHDISRKITEGVISFEIDFGIVVNPVRHPDLVIRQLCTDTVSFWTAESPSPVQCMDSKQGVLICDMHLAQVQVLLGKINKKKQVFRRIIQSGNLELIAELTAAGAGVGILPERVARRSAYQNLQSFDEKLPVFRDRVCLVYRADAQKTRGSRAISEAIIDAFGPKNF